MHVVGPLSRHFDPSRVTSPESHGAVAWEEFNRSFHQLQQTDWRVINAASNARWYWKMFRLGIAFYAQRTGAYLDLKGKADAFARFQDRLPANPSIVFFGAEAGWEPLLLQTLLGSDGRVLLIDDDGEAYQRYVDAPDDITLKLRGATDLKHMRVRRNRNHIEYKREDLFELTPAAEFDIAIDWGLIEHFPGESKRPLLDQMKRFVRPGGWHISAVPRDSWQNRLFYRAFSDELNFGYRELVTQHEFECLWRDAGLSIVDSVPILDSVVILAQHESTDTAKTTV